MSTKAILHYCTALACLAFLAGPAWAEKADRDKPMNIEADTLHYDDLKQVSQFAGNVVVTKGSMVIRGEHINVRQDPQGYQYANVLPEPGKLAYFKQNRDMPNEYVEAQAKSMDYNGFTDMVTLTDDAVLRRYQDGSLHDEVQGQVVTYNNTTDFFTVVGRAKGSPGSSATPSNPGGRVRVMLSPRAPTAPAASNTSSASSTMRLSPGLDSAAPANKAGDGQ